MEIYSTHSSGHETHGVCCIVCMIAVRPYFRRGGFNFLKAVLSFKY